MKNDLELIAPCGMFCGLCSSYLAWARALPRRPGKLSHCEGCRPRNKSCAFLKRDCRRLRTGQVHFCYECPDFPCKPLSGLDERYRRKYGMSMIANLEEIRDRGMTAFLRRQRKRHGCPNCRDWVSAHNGKCFICQPVHSWKD